MLFDWLELRMVVHLVGYLQGNAVGDSVAYNPSEEHVVFHML